VAARNAKSFHIVVKLADTIHWSALRLFWRRTVGSVVSVSVNLLDKHCEIMESRDKKGQLSILKSILRLITGRFVIVELRH